jgi:FAD/FMN-containing dehydrogenase
MLQPAPDLHALEDAIGGDVLLPGSPGYESVRRPAIARFEDVRPEAVVRCSSSADVAETIAFARRGGRHVAVRSGGHCFAGRSSTTGIVIDVSPRRSVAVSDGLATIGAGARLGDVYDTLEAEGLTIPAGCGPTVGIAGLTLGGGLGILGRKHGLTSDHLVGAEVVLADGRAMVCDDDRESELLWALRGGGGGFGVVTTFRFRTVPPPDATSFHLVWPHTDGPAVVAAWQDWAPGAPDELAASLLVTAAGQPEEPPLVHVFGSMADTASRAAELLGELVARAGTDPASTSLEHMPYRGTKRYLAEHGPGADRPGGHPYSKSEYFRQPLPDEAVVALIDHLSKGRLRGQSRELDFTPWAGAYNRVPEDATAFAHRNERFLLKHAVVVDADTSGPELEAARGWLRRSWGLVHPWGSWGVYPNFPDRDLEDLSPAYCGRNHDRLLRVKAGYDPDGFFRFRR